MRVLSLVTAFLTAASSSIAFAQNTAGDLSVIVFQSGKPVKNAQLAVGDDIIQLTNKIGSAHVIIPSGIHLVEVSYKKKTLASVELLTIDGEDTQIIVSVPTPGKQADVDIETSDTDTITETETTEGQTVDKGRGTLSGKIVSLENNKALAGAKIYISGTRVDLASDQNGTFDVELPSGVYSLSVILPGYASVTLDGVEISKDQTTQKNIELSPAGLELSEFVVLAPYIEGSVASIVEETRNSSEVKEVLGAEQMSQAGDSNAAGALARVTGLTIEDEKYVVVRGQPPRYTLSLVNGSPLPSPDPIRRVVPLDLFPTGVLASIDVQKSFSTDKPGSFGGGLVDLSLRSIPEESFTQISLSTAFNSLSTFQQGLMYEGGSTDFLGEDDGTRAIPQQVLDATQNGTRNLNQVSDAERIAAGKSFDNNYKVKEDSLLPDVSGSITGGTRFDTKYGEFGLLGDFSWGQKFRLRDELERVLSLDGDTLIVESEYNISKTTVNTGISALIVAGGKWNNHEVISNTFFIRDTDKITQLKEGLNNTSDERYEKNYTLDWNQRELFVQQFAGHHDFTDVFVDWRALTADGHREVLDKRTYIYFRQPDGSFEYYEEESAKREFNTVDDNVESLALDLTIPLTKNNSFTSSFKVGAASDKQDRLSDTARFSFEPDGAGIDLSQNPDLVLHPSLVGNGINFSDDTQDNDDYTGESTVTGQYLMADMKFADVLRLNVGLREEDANFSVKTFSRSSQGSKEVISGFANRQTLPAASATWFLNKEMQLRASYSKTVSYPVLVELSNTLYTDPDSGDVYFGNPDLEPAVITGFDTRWEWYFSTEELISLGLFRREYENPIENGFFPKGGGDPRLTINNAESAVVNGVEVSGRFSLNQLLENMYLQSNITLMESSVGLEKGTIATSSNRPLQGQANYVFNFQLGHDGERHDWAVTLNQVGERLAKTNVYGRPDIYRQPVPELNAKWSWQINKMFKSSLTGTNLLNPEYEFKAGSLVERSYKKGITVRYSLSAEF